MGEAIIGIMLDVSGSMKETFNLDRSTDTDVEKSHTILTSIMNIVKREVVQHNCKESVFTCAFGLDQSPEICDLTPLLEYFSTTRTENVYEKLFRLAKYHGAYHAEEWIRRTLSEFQAALLFDCLRSDSHLARELAGLIPSGFPTTVYQGVEVCANKVGNIVRTVASLWGGNTPANFGTRYLDAQARDSNAYKRACEIISQRIKSCIMEHLKPRSVQQVSKILDVLLHSTEAPSAESSSLHHKIRELLDPMKPFIFGGTPMCKALNEARDILMKTNASRKVLFILSDGDSSDGDPRPIAEGLRSLGVTIITCFLTSHGVENPKCLLYEADDSWAHKDGRRVLFEMSSIMKNTHTPITYLVDADWELSSEGCSHLFIEVNSLDVVDEFCKIVVSQMTRPCDALLHILEKINLATYVNQQNAQFEPKQQHKATCYANAIAAVFHLTLNQIVGRRCPTFETIRKGIIEESGSHGADVEQVLEQFCPQYQLRYRKVDEEGARRAINERRVLVAEFCLDDDQWEQFHKFYEDHSGGILGRHNLNSSGGFNRAQIGHAVVLTGCDPDYLMFMNSWGKDFAAGGFFRVKDETVLSQTQFFDVYWKDEDLTASEKRAFEEASIKRIRELSEEFPSVNDLLCQCPKCHQTSTIADYEGHPLEAQCPRCCQKFKPIMKNLVEGLYCKVRKF